MAIWRKQETDDAAGSPGNRAMVCYAAATQPSEQGDQEREERLRVLETGRS